MLAACAPLAKWIDVFCEPASAHAFDGDESRAVLVAGRDAGLLLRVHGNQLGHGPGVRLAVELGAASVDHCTLPVGRRRRRARRLGHGGDAAARRRVQHPLAVPGRPPAARRRSDGRAGQRLQSRHLLQLVDAVRDRPRSSGDAHDAGRGALAGTAGAAAALRRDDIGRIAVGAPPTSPCSTRRATCTWPTGRACRSPARSTCRADADDQPDVTDVVAARSGFGTVGRLAVQPATVEHPARMRSSHCRRVRAALSCLVLAACSEHRRSRPPPHDRRPRASATATASGVAPITTGCSGVGQIAGPDRRPDRTFGAELDVKSADAGYQVLVDPPEESQHPDLPQRQRRGDPGHPDHRHRHPGHAGPDGRLRVPSVRQRGPVLHRAGGPGRLPAARRDRLAAGAQSVGSIGCRPMRDTRDFVVVHVADGAPVAVWR